jgi:hypothetical protein
MQYNNGLALNCRKRNVNTIKPVTGYVWQIMLRVGPVVLSLYTSEWKLGEPYKIFQIRSIALLRFLSPTWPPKLELNWINYRFVFNVS